MPEEGRVNQMVELKKLAARPNVCPECGGVVQVLLFMGRQPDGCVCQKCCKLFALDFTLLADMVI